MDAQGGYASALAALAGGGGPSAGGASPGAMGMPPPPTNIGAMPTGDPASDPKSAISDGILALRTVKNHFPHAQDQIDGMISELQSLSSKGGAPPGPQSGAPSPPQGGGAPVAPPPVGM